MYGLAWRNIRTRAYLFGRHGHSLRDGGDGEMLIGTCAIVRVMVIVTRLGEVFGGDES